MPYRFSSLFRAFDVSVTPPVCYCVSSHDGIHPYLVIADLPSLETGVRVVLSAIILSPRRLINHPAMRYRFSGATKPLTFSGI